MRCNQAKYTELLNFRSISSTVAFLPKSTFPQQAIDGSGFDLPHLENKVETKVSLSQYLCRNFEMEMYVVCHVTNPAEDSIKQ